MTSLFNEFLDLPAPNCQISLMNKSSSPYVEFNDAVRLLRDGSVCAFPTDTVFGLGVRADNVVAVTELFALKQRPLSKPLIALCADIEMVKTLVKFSKLSEALVSLWPGALTLVLPQLQSSKIALEVNAGMNNLGVRIPNSPLIQQLITAVGVPIATSSANVSGGETGLDAQSIKHQFSQKVPILKTQHQPLGLESTILQVTGDSVILLRKGALSLEDILQRTGVSVVY